MFRDKTNISAKQREDMTWDGLSTFWQYILAANSAAWGARVSHQVSGNEMLMIKSNSPSLSQYSCYIAEAKLLRIINSIRFLVLPRETVFCSRMIVIGNAADSGSVDNQHLTKVWESIKKPRYAANTLCRCNLDWSANSVLLSESSLSASVSRFGWKLV